MRTIWLVAVLAFVITSFVSAQGNAALPKPAQTMQKGMMQSQQKIVTPDQIKWMKAPADRPAGTQWAPLDGNPNGRGNFTMLIKYPAGTQFMPHSFSHDIRLTVIDGEVHFGFGSRMDKSSATALPKTGFVFIPANTNHFLWTDNEAVLEVQSMGPSGMVKYVNPNDNPMGKSTSKATEEKKEGE